MTNPELKDQKEEMIEFLKLVKKACFDFMKAEDCADYTADFVKKENLLKIHIPDKELFKKFIEHLAKSSLPFLEKAKQKHEKQQEKQKIPDPAQEKLKMESYTSPTPFDAIKKGLTLK